MNERHKAFLKLGSKKGKNIVSASSLGKFELQKYHKGQIEIIKINLIEGGIEVLAKAWDKNNNPIGFGKNGSIEIERFRFFNPPTLIPDGTTSKQMIDGHLVEFPNFKEDAEQALLDILDHTLSASRANQVFDSKNIIKGKIGSTTTTIYAESGGDGAIDASGTNFATLRGQANGDSADKTNLNLRLCYSIFSSPDYTLYRGYAPFISTIAADQQIDSASFWGFGSFKTDNNSQSIVLVKTTQASPTDLVVSDWSKTSANEIASRKTIADFTATDWNEWVITDLTFITLTGTNILIGSRISKDVDNVAPGTSADTAGILSANNTGTTSDPKLVIVHSTAITSSIKKLMGVVQASVKKISPTAIASVKKVAGVANV
jgi:hypothetical protein